MPDQEQLRILTPDGTLTHDTFIMAAEQPTKIKTGCLLVVHEGTGRQVTVHSTRLFPADTIITHRPGPHRDVCPTCGRVAGVIEDQVMCPYRGDTHCGLVEHFNPIISISLPPAKETAPTHPAE